MSFLESAGLGLLGGVGSWISNLFNQNSQYKQARKLMDYQFDLQKKQFDYTNEYNSPVAQMNRLTAAGLNPNLVYGSGDVVANSKGMPQVSGQAAQRGEFDALRGLELARYSQEVKQMQANVELTKAQTDKAWNESENVKEQRRLIGQQIKESVARTASTQWQTDFNRSVERYLQQIKENEAHRTTYEWWNLRDYGALQIEAGLKKIGTEIENLMSSRDLTLANIEKVFSDIQVNKARIKEIASSTAVNEARVNEIIFGIKKAIFEENFEWLKWQFNKYGSSEIGAVLNAVVGLTEEVLDNTVSDAFDSTSESIRSLRMPVRSRPR